MAHWQISPIAAGIRLHRPGATRFDVLAEARFPALRKTVLAHEIRKDLWRMLQSLRGFSPVVEVVDRDGGLCVRVGGQVSSHTWPRENTLTQIQTLLSSPSKRARWIAHARL